ncbi:hypothetical protein F5883DRAFT_620473 [Diaporthe sp. PMI_573]|nr:hypothetical protein F5883DRAFT_620473 [Diaporthaceae sp. PMI_573]
MELQAHTHKNYRQKTLEDEEDYTGFRAVTILLYIADGYFSPKPTPTKLTLKAMPTMRNHTSDQLGDEYIPQKFDEDGEKKIMPDVFLFCGVRKSAVGSVPIHLGQHACERFAVTMHRRLQVRSTFEKHLRLATHLIT